MFLSGQAVLWWFCEPYLYIWVEGSLTQTFPVRSCLKAQLVHAGGERFLVDQSMTAAFFIRCPESQRLNETSLALSNFIYNV